MLVTKDIIARVSDIQGVVSLANDDLGEDDLDSNIVLINSHIDPSTGEVSEEPLYLRLPRDAYRNKRFMEWIVSTKSGEDEETFDLYTSVIYQEVKVASKAELGQGQQLMQMIIDNPLNNDDIVQLEMKMEPEIVNEKLEELKKEFGYEYLSNLSERALYQLYKQKSTESDS